MKITTITTNSKEKVNSNYNNIGTKYIKEKNTKHKKKKEPKTLQKSESVKIFKTEKKTLTFKPYIQPNINKEKDFT